MRFELRIAGPDEEPPRPPSYFRAKGARWTDLGGKIWLWAARQPEPSDQAEPSHVLLNGHDLKAVVRAIRQLTRSQVRAGGRMPYVIAVKVTTKDTRVVRVDRTRFLLFANECGWGPDTLGPDLWRGAQNP